MRFDQSAEEGAAEVVVFLFAAPLPLGMGMTPAVGDDDEGGRFFTSDADGAEGPPGLLSQPVVRPRPTARARNSPAVATQARFLIIEAISKIQVELRNRTAPRFDPFPRSRDQSIKSISIAVRAEDFPAVGSRQRPVHAEGGQARLRVVRPPQADGVLDEMDR